MTRNYITRSMFCLLLLMVTAVSFSSCDTSKKVAYDEAHNYFVRNDVGEAQSQVITSQDQFDRLFSGAAVMGKNGQPTEIDFTKQAVVAIILPETDRPTEINVSKPLLSMGHLWVGYDVERGEPQSYTMRPMKLLVIDRKWAEYPARITENSKVK